MKARVEKYRRYLDQALDAVFRDHQADGFWDEKDGRIIKRLIQEPDGQWSPDLSFDLRYGPFGLMGALYWRYRNSTRPDHDIKLTRHLDYLVKHTTQPVIRERGQYAGTNYGILSSLALGYLVFKKEAYLKKALEIFSFNQDHFLRIRNNILSLVVWGECWLHEALEAQGKGQEILQKVRSVIRARCQWFIKCQDGRGYFRTGDHRAIQFARTMYTLWGLSKAAAILKKTSWFLPIERALDHQLQTQRTEDGAFLWHPKFYFTPLSVLPIPLPVYYPFGAEWLFECHQTFFINAAEQYQSAGGKKVYLRDEIEAVEWIFGHNRLQKDLVDLAGIGVPIRVMNLEGETSIKKENFKGTYEIGSYLMALTGMIRRLEAAEGH